MTRAPSRSKLTHSRSAPTVLRGAAQAATANNPEHDEAEPWRRGRVGFLAALGAPLPPPGVDADAPSAPRAAPPSAKLGAWVAQRSREYTCHWSAPARGGLESTQRWSAMRSPTTRTTSHRRPRGTRVPFDACSWR